jgi:hypothetical protein
MDTALFESHLKFPVCEKEILTHDRKACPLGIAQKEIIWTGGAKKNHSASGGSDPAFGFSLQRVQCSNSTSVSAPTYPSRTIPRSSKIGMELRGFAFPISAISRDVGDQIKLRGAQSPRLNLSS